MDSPAANAAFAKQIDIKFPLLSDMNKKMLKDYGILKDNDVQGQTYQWAERANIVIDKDGIVFSSTPSGAWLPSCSTSNPAAARSIPITRWPSVPTFIKSKPASKSLSRATVC